MEGGGSGRRSFHRHLLKTALRVRVAKSGSTERRAESQNLSESGTFFATDEPMAIGSAVEILLKMPEVISGNPTTEWRFTRPVAWGPPTEKPPGQRGRRVQNLHY